MNSKAVRVIFSIFLMVFANSAFAQIANGDFSGSSNLWNWSGATTGLIPACNSATYTPSNAYIWNGGTAPASGKIAQIIPYQTYSSGAVTYCGRIEQNVYVPQGKKLKFVYQIGVAVGPAYVPRTLETAYLNVFITDLATNVKQTVFGTSGKSKECSGPDSCPKFYAFEFDVSAYWGKNVKITFQGNTSGYGTSGWPSPVLIDNVVLE